MPNPFSPGSLEAWPSRRKKDRRRPTAEESRGTARSRVSEVLLEQRVGLKVRRFRVWLGLKARGFRVSLGFERVVLAKAGSAMKVCEGLEGGEAGGVGGVVRASVDHEVERVAGGVLAASFLRMCSRGLEQHVVTLASWRGPHWEGSSTS